MPRRLSGIARVVGANMGSGVLIVVGVAMLIASLYQRTGRDPFATALAVLGTGLVFFGCTLPRVSDVELTPGKLKASLREVRDTTTRYATDNPEEIRAQVAEMPEPELVSIARAALGTQVLVSLLRNQRERLRIAWFISSCWTTTRAGWGRWSCRAPRTRRCNPGR